MGRIHRLVQCGGGRERRAHRAVAAFAVGLGSSSALMFSAAAAGDKTGSAPNGERLSTVATRTPGVR